MRWNDFLATVVRKNIEGQSHIACTCQEFEQQGTPIISVVGKKKELIGHFKNQGAEWESTEHHIEVNVEDFLSLDDGKALP